MRERNLSGLRTRIARRMAFEFAIENCVSLPFSVQLGKALEMAA
jgi:hypothetical protein